MIDINLALRKRISQLATQRGISLRKLNLLAGLNQTTIHNLYEVHEGKPRTLNLLSVYDICKALNITMQDFFESKEFNDSIMEYRNQWIEEKKKVKG